MCLDDSVDVYIAYTTSFNMFAKKILSDINHYTKWDFGQFTWVAHR